MIGVEVLLQFSKGAGKTLTALVWRWLPWPVLSAHRA
jgi:hypothetical protein